MRVPVVRTPHSSLPTSFDGQIGPCGFPCTTLRHRGHAVTQNIRYLRPASNAGRSSRLRFVCCSAA
jgi:hypothetical protein